MTTDSVLNNPGYTVRAASSDDRDVLDAAFRYPPYELPIDMWKDLPPVALAPCRLARTEHPDGSAWVVHSAYLAKDTVDRDRSYFSHLLLLPAADPAAVLRSWGAAEWIKSYPQGADQKLPGNVRLPVGSLVNDANLTAFLGDNPPDTLELSATVCPDRLRGSSARRRDLFAHVVRAVLLLCDEDKERQVYVHAEPGLVAAAPLRRGATSAADAGARSRRSPHTSPYHRNIRNYELARVVGISTSGRPRRGWGPNSMPRGASCWTRSTPPGRHPSCASRRPSRSPAGVNDLIDLAARGDWARMDDIHQTVGGEWDVGGWLREAGARAGGRLPPLPLELDSESEVLSLDEPDVLPVSGPVSAPQTEPTAVPSLPPSRPVGGMTYAAQISRTNPACLLFLVDQSKSMADPFIAGTGQTKAGVVADALNRLIQNVVLRSAKADGVRDYFRVGVIGYGAGIKAGLGGSVQANVLVPISEG